MATKNTVSAAAWATFSAEQQALLTAAGVKVETVAAPKSKVGVAELKAYEPKNGDKGVGVYLVVGPYGSQLFTRLCDGVELTAEGKAKAESIIRDMTAVLAAGIVAPPKAK